MNRIILTGVGVIALCPCAVVILNGTGEVCFGFGSVVVVLDSRNILYVLALIFCPVYIELCSVGRGTVYSTGCGILNC